MSLLSVLALTACSGDVKSAGPAAAQCPGRTDFGHFVDIPDGQFRNSDQPVYVEEQPGLTLNVGAFQI